MLEFRENKCPNCGAPADADDRTCNYCYAKIPRQGDEQGHGALVCTMMFAAVAGIVGLDWYVGLGLTDSLVQACQHLSAALQQ